MKSRPWVIALALTLPVLGACGGPEALDPAAAESLQQQVRELATVTQDGNLELAVDRAEALKTEVQQAQESGAVTPGRAGRIQANIDAFIESIQPVEAPAQVAPTTQPATEPAPAPPTFTAPAKGVREDSRDPGETQTDRDRERAEEAAEEAQKRAEKEEKERQKQEEENREGGDD